MKITAFIAQYYLKSFSFVNLKEVYKKFNAECRTVLKKVFQILDTGHVLMAQQRFFLLNIIKEIKINI